MTEQQQTEYLPKDRHELGVAMCSRVVITTAAAKVLARVRKRNGAVLFHQSGGCCEGSGPSCFRQGTFIISPHDVLLGTVLDGEATNDAETGTPVWISRTQFESWQHTQVVIDVAEGMGTGGFSLEGPDGFSFLSRARVFSDEEFAAVPPALTKTQIDAGAEPAAPIAPVDLEGDFGVMCQMPTL